MELSREISTELWEAISTSYVAGHFSHAIVDTMHHLSDAIRNKSGLDGDGAPLVGQALGGDLPRLRVNSMQTESERNVQRGLETILRGMYIGIRNPRSHDKHQDKKEIADAIIVFVNYLLQQLEATKDSFSVEGFLESVRDPEFVNTDRYAELLAKQVPAMRRADALLAVYRERSSIDLSRTHHLITALTSQLSEQQLNTYLANVSEELRTSREDSEVRTALQMLTPELWPKLNEISRLRIENKLHKSISDGKAFAHGKVVGALGTWAEGYLKVFTTRDEVERMIIAKMEWGDEDDRNYVSAYFMHRLPEFILDRSADLIEAIATAVRAGEAVTTKKLVEEVRGFPDTWQQELAKAMQDLANPDKPAVRLGNGAPFLSKKVLDDDIPF